MLNAATNPSYVFNAYILFSGLYNKSACLQVSTWGQDQRSININVFTVILTTRFSNTRFADDHFGLCPYFFSSSWHSILFSLSYALSCQQNVSIVLEPDVLEWSIMWSNKGGGGVCQTHTLNVIILIQQVLLSGSVFCKSDVSITRFVHTHWFWESNRAILAIFFYVF